MLIVNEHKKIKSENNSICFQDECHCDADCGSGSACMCPDQPGSPFNFAYCVSAGCHTDSDCPGKLRCVQPPSAPCPVATAGYYCETDTGACRTDADCTEPGAVCAHDDSDWVCSTVICNVP